MKIKDLIGLIFDYIFFTTMNKLLIIIIACAIFVTLEASQ